jgi:AmiR/NasT family two-component response regulator
MDELTRRLNEALVNRAIIAQAQGVIMQRSGVGADDAYTLLRRWSVTSGRPLREEAADLVASTQAGTARSPSPGDHG